jgi:tRNA1(Val) A37 N6-methylase TrmN6
MWMTVTTSSETVFTRDAFLRGRIHLRQPARGYRAGLDAVLLAAAVDAKEGSRLAEAGCGAGTASLCLLARRADLSVGGFERDSAMAHLAGANAADNAARSRMSVSLHDIADRAADLQNSFDGAFSNPPFFEPGRALEPAEGRQAAYMAETPLRDWVLFLAHVTRRGGWITIIHRAAELTQLLALMDAQAGEIEVLPVRPAPGLPASRVLVRGRKGLRRGPLTLHAGLDLHVAPGGVSTERAAAALDGGPLEWKG